MSLTASTPAPALKMPYQTGSLVERTTGLKVFFGAIIVGLAAGVFSKTILAEVFMGAELFFRYFLVLFYFFYLADKIMIKGSFNYFDIVILVLLSVPIYTAFSAKREFGQPILDGILAQNYLMMYIAGIFVFYLIRIGWLTLSGLKTSFLILTWASLILYTATELFADPANYTDTEFVRSKDTKGGYFFKYFTYFIAFGGLYYAINFFFLRRTKSLLLFIPFLLFMVLINNGRTDLVVFLSTVMYIFFRHQSIKRILVYGTYTFIIILVFVGVMLVFFQEESAIMYDMYSSYFTVLSGQEAEDNSATSRLLQIGMASEFLLNNPDALVFGAGKVGAGFSNSSSAVTEWVNPVDIGIVGLVFTHGLIGLVIMYSQFVFVLYFLKKIKHAENDMFFITLKYMLLMIFIQSFFKGPLFYLPGQLVTILGILYAYLYRDFDISRQQAQLESQTQLVGQ